MSNVLPSHCDRCGAALDKVRGSNGALLGVRGCANCYRDYEAHTTFDRKEFLRCDTCKESPCECLQRLQAKAKQIPTAKLTFDESIAAPIAQAKRPDFECTCPKQYDQTGAYRGHAPSTTCCIHGDYAHTDAYRQSLDVEMRAHPLLVAENPFKAFDEFKDRLDREIVRAVLGTSDPEGFRQAPIGGIVDESEYPRVNTPEETRALMLADKCQTLEDDNRNLLAENATLRRRVEKLERKR